MRSCQRWPHLVQLKNSVMPSSVLAEKNTASLWPQASQVTSLVLGSVGSALTSCRITVFSFEVCVISFLHHKCTFQTMADCQLSLCKHQFVS